VAPAPKEEPPVTPEQINQLLFTGALLALGWLGSWLQSFINSRRRLAEKVNVLLTAFYAILAPTAIVLYQQGQLDFSSVSKALSSAALVLLVAWVRHNGGKLTKPVTSGENTSEDDSGSATELPVETSTTAPQKAPV
jgi:hypothetical protein